MDVSHATAARGQVRKLLFVTTGAVLAVTLIATAAVALPNTSPLHTLGTNGKVRALVQVGGVMWVGGQFTALTDGTPVDGLAALDVSTGDKAGGVSPPILGGTGFVYDLTTDGSTV